MGNLSEMTARQVTSPAKEIDLDLLVFTERYVTNLLKWDLLIFFGHNPDARRTAQEMTSQVGRSYKAVRSALGDLAILELLQKSNGCSQPVYELTHNAILRAQVIKFAGHSASNSSEGVL